MNIDFSTFHMHSIFWRKLVSVIVSNFELNVECPSFEKETFKWKIMKTFWIAFYNLINICLFRGNKSTEK